MKQNKISDISPIFKLAYREEFKGNTERSTAAYKEVREDASTGLTHKLPLEVEFQNRANKKQKNYILLSILVIMIIIVYLIALIKIAG
ncbi:MULTISPECIES: palindromic element RPE1 domain-containing protein [spotted fever group]|uniref:tRNA pseudouridine synthase B n=1 Tax=Rickettsia tamurae subsp. buchneri TaxID=1462938 RepID=A0A8E1C0A6_9RICK|nr:MULTISPECIES: palindromic element RPE1 domain-containing protein [spotted fever group]EER21544.1 DNA polymerase I [Rickettsia endosymbiont of Ixodes scapularis]KDO03291.1 tRNA pseudouridine synthase B [Rickettsia tamurae subsp. buchneri]